MALKDWEIDWESNGEIIYSKGNKECGVRQEGLFEIIAFVDINGSPKITRHFKTKSQALNFAKQYMRTH